MHYSLYVWSAWLCVRRFILVGFFRHKTVLTSTNQMHMLLQHAIKYCIFKTSACAEMPLFSKGQARDSEVFVHELVFQEKEKKEITATHSHLSTAYSRENNVLTNFIKVLNNTFKITKQPGKSKNFFRCLDDRCQA